MTSAKKVLVVGFGIGGATAAYAMSRAGLDVHAIDIRHGDAAMGGVGICLLQNALRVLRSIDLAGPCLESGLLFEVVREFDHAGNLQGAHPAPPGIGIRRPDLARILETAAEQAGATLEKGLTVADLRQRSDAVEVVFSDGREAVYDVVVVADGAYSQLRAKVFGGDLAPRFAGQSGWRFAAPRPPEIDGFCIFRSPKGRSVGALPTSKDGCYIFFLENSAAPLRMPDDQLHVLIRERMQEYTAPALRQGLDLLADPRQVLFRPFDITLVPAPWHRGRVVLIGDAAHAPTPQMTSGGGMAIEDAVVLTECLAGTSSVADALEAYSRRRFDRVKTVFDASLQLSRYEQEDSVGNKQKTMALLLQTYQFLGQPI